MLMNLARNTLYGPFMEGRRMREAREAVMEYAAVAGPNCPIFSSLIPSMLDDKDEGFRMSERDIASTVWTEFLDAPIWNSSGSKLSVSRFCSMVTRPREQDDYWTFRWFL